MSDQPAIAVQSKPVEVFVSYASADLARAEALHARLAGAGFSVWFDKARLIAGCDWHKEIQAGCDAARVIVPLLTPAWRNSEWTRYETYASPLVVPVVPEGEPEDVLTPPLRRWQAVRLDPLAADEAAWRGFFSAIRTKLDLPVPTRLPFLLRLPHAPNPHFTGREADMDRLHEELHAAPVAALTQANAHALTALGGVGKTTLANEYVRRYWRLWPQILWVDVRRGYQAQFAAIFDQMFPDLAFNPIPDARKAERVRDVLRQPRDPYERLLVLDNVADEASAADWIPGEGGCRTLITSRFTGFSAAIRVILLEVLSPNAARAMLVSRSGRAAEGRDGAACDELARRLGYLPLALELAAAYIAVQRIGFAEYLRLFEAAAKELLARHEPGSTHYPDSVATTWLTTIARLTPEARAILRLSSVLGEAPIPLTMLIESAPRIAILGATLPAIPPARSFLSWLRGPRAADPMRAPPEPDRARAEVAVRAAVGDQLHRYSMIQNWDGATFRVHPLVRLVEWWEMDKPARRYAMELAARLLTARPPPAPNDAGSRAASDVFLAHGTGLRARLSEEGAAWPDHVLPGFLSEQAAARGDVTAADGFAIDHYEAAKRRLGPIHAITRTAASTVAFRLYAKGDYANAAAIYRVLLEGHEVQDGAEHPDTLASVNNLAGCLRAMGDAAGALPLYRSALESSERVLGAEHPNTLSSVNNLAGCLRAMGDAAGALPLYRKALESSERVLGAEHPDTLSSLNNLAGCLEALGDAAGALPLYRRALESRERVLGAEHPQTLTSVNNLAGCLETLGDAAGALPLYRRALESRERVLGVEHPNTLTSVNNLAYCLETLGDAAGALPLYRRALESCERVLGAEHPQTLTSVNNLASCLETLGDAAGALPLYRRALESRERVLGVEHPNTLTSVNNLAYCLQTLGDAAGALPLYRRALESRERVLGAEHPQTLTSVNNLAGCLETLGDAAGALPLYRRALESRERVLGAEHPDTLSSVNSLAYCLQALGDAAGALPLYRRALESRERVLGAEHPDTLSSVNNLAYCLQALGDAAGALPLYRKALESREPVLGAEHPQTLTSVNNLATCLHALGDAAGALPLFRRALESYERVLGAEHPETIASADNLTYCLKALSSAAEG